MAPLHVEVFHPKQRRWPPKNDAAQNPDFRFLSTHAMRAFWTGQGDTVYYKNPRMYEMDDGIGDIQAKITDDQARILRHASATFSCRGPDMG